MRAEHEQRLCWREPRLGSAQRRFLGWLGKQIRKAHIVLGLRFPQNFPGHTGTPTALATDAQIFAKLAHGLTAIFCCVTNLMVGYTRAKTYVHKKTHWPHEMY